MMHRTIEQMEVANIDAEIREKMAACQDAETMDEVNSSENQVVLLRAKKEKLKEKIKEDDQKAKEKRKGGMLSLMEENLFDQTWR